MIRAIKIILFAIFGGFVAAPSSAAMVVESRFDGVLTAGIDGSGLLGVPGASLAGKPVTLVFFLNPKFGKWNAANYSGGVYRTQIFIDGQYLPFKQTSGGYGQDETLNWAFGANTASLGVFVTSYPRIGIKSIEFYAPPYSRKAIFADGTWSSETSFTRDSAALPEPGVWLCLLLGFAAVGFTMRRRKADALFGRNARLRLSSLT